MPIAVYTAVRWWEFEWIKDPDPTAVFIAAGILLAAVLLLVILDISAHSDIADKLKRRNGGCSTPS
jgi:hypothetical protein